MTQRTCSDCPAPISRSSRGRCRPCAAAYVNGCPEIARRRRAALAAKFADPSFRAEQAARLAVSASTPRAIRLRRERGKEQAREVLFRPDVRAHTMRPEARARAGRSVSERALGWCPVARREEYRHLVRDKRIPAAEARAIILAELPGSVEHARRQIANRELVGRLRHERQVEEAY
jgi:hypothetical protein